jgi:hypothetical protein
VAKLFSFSLLLILDEGGLREGWVKSAYSLLAATAVPQNHNKKTARQNGTAKQRRIGGRQVPRAKTRIITKQQKSAAKRRQNGSKTAANQRPPLHSNRRDAES